MPEFRGRGAIENEISRMLAREMSRIRREVQAELIAANFDINATRFASPTEWGRMSAVLEAQMKRRLEEVYIAAAEQFMDAASYGMADDMLRAAANAWAGQAAQNLVIQMNDTSRRQVISSLDKFFGQSMNNAELRRELQRIFSPRRADLIAITEVTRAASEGSERIANELRAQGVQMVAVWFTLLDERVCPICGARHEKQQGDGWVFLPPAHPYCRCFVNYEVLQAEGNG